MFGDGPLGREICGDEAGIRALPAGAIRDFWRTMYRPSNTVVAVAGDLEHDEAVALAAAAFGSGNGAIPAFEPAPDLPAGPRVLTGRRDTSQAQLAIAVPALRRDHPDAWNLAVLNAVLGDGMSQPPVPRRSARRRGSPTTCRSGIVEYADSGALEVSAGVDPVQLPAAIEAILAEVARLRRRAGARRGAGEGEGLPVRRARAADGRHAPPRVVDRRPGGAPRPGLTLDEALEAVEAVAAADVRRLAEDSFRDEALRMAVVAPARHLRGLERAPAAARD